MYIYGLYYGVRCICILQRKFNKTYCLNFYFELHKKTILTINKNANFY